jgi:DNA-directed RNA polymerase subunit RPC12/RpoP
MSQPTIVRADYHKARKFYKCCECGDTIEIGQKYAYTFGVWDGEADSFRQCLSCDKLFMKLSELQGYPVDDDEGVCFGGLIQELQEYRMIKNLGQGEWVSYEPWIKMDGRIPRYQEPQEHP